MKKVLIFGDTHMPSRRDSIPTDFYRHIEQTHYDLALVTGDLVRESDMRDALPRLPKCYIVKGNMDYGHNYRFHEQLDIEELHFLLLHGTQLRPRGSIENLWEIASEVGADVAIHGHTHVAAIDLYNNRLFLNPGTISGAAGGPGRIDASFIEIDVDDSSLTVELHTTNWNVSKSSVIEFMKLDGAMVKK